MTKKRSYNMKGTRNISKIKNRKKQAMIKKIKESEIPEEYRLPLASYSIKHWSDDPKKQEEYRQSSIDYLKTRIQGLKEGLWDAHSAKERAEIRKLILYFKQKLHEYERYMIPHKDMHGKRHISKRC